MYQYVHAGKHFPKNGTCISLIVSINNGKQRFYKSVNYFKFNACACTVTVICVEDGCTEEQPNLNIIAHVLIFFFEKSCLNIYNWQ